MSGILLSSSASETSSSSSDSSSDSPASTGSSTPPISGRLSPPLEADEVKAGGSLPTRALAEADRAVLDLGGPSVNPLGAVADRFKGALDHSVDLDDIMLIFGTEEVQADGGEAEEAARWLLVDVDNGQDRGKKRGEADECQQVAEGEFFGFREKEGAEAGQLLVEGLVIGVGPGDWAVGCQTEVGERESGCGSGAEDKGTSEAEERRKSEAEGKRRSEAEEGRGGAEERERVESVQESEAEGSEECTKAIVLAKSLGLGSSSDSGEDDTVDPLAILADERQLSVGGESSRRGGECESEGLTEEAGPARGEMHNSGIIDEEWRQKTLALNGEEIANPIYHIPKGYRLYLPPKGSSIHYPPDGYVGVYLKDLEFGLRFPLADEIAQIINRMGLSLGQMTPQSIRVIVAYVWVCRFFGVPPTVDLFRSLHHIALVSNGYWMVVSEPGKLVVWPKKSSTKDWK